MASLGMKCTAGGCLYEAGGPQPPAPPVPHEHKTNLVRAFSCAARRSSAADCTANAQLTESPLGFSSRPMSAQYRKLW